MYICISNNYWYLMLLIRICIHKFVWLCLYIINHMPLFYIVAPNPINVTSIRIEKIDSNDLRITWKVRT